VAVRSAVICGLCRGKTVLHAALPSLIRALNGPGDDDGRLWLTAAEALGERGSEAAEAIPALEGALSRDKRPRPAFFRALWKIDRKYVPLSLRAVKSLPQESALVLLEEIGPEAAEAVPAIISFLVSAKRDLRFSPYGSPELRALAAIGGPAVPALVDGLAKEDVILRVLAAETLGKIGADAETAVPALEKALSDEDDEVRREAAKALRKIRGAAAPAGPAVEDRP